MTPLPQINGRPMTIKTDAGNGSDGIRHVINASLSPSPEPGRQVFHRVSCERKPINAMSSEQTVLIHGNSWKRADIAERVAEYYEQFLATNSNATRNV